MCAEITTGTSRKPPEVLGPAALALRPKPEPPTAKTQSNETTTISAPKQTLTSPTGLNMDLVATDADEPLSSPQNTPPSAPKQNYGGISLSFGDIPLLNMLDDWRSRTDDPWNTLNGNNQAPDGQSHNAPTQPSKGEPNIIKITDLTRGDTYGGDRGEATAPHTMGLSQFVNNNLQPSFNNGGQPHLER